ncbi:MAG: hypothetical protein AB1410_04170 [Acidobacteriota bacterium]
MRIFLRFKKITLLLVLILFLIVSLGFSAEKKPSIPVQQFFTLDESLIKGLMWRCIGSANMGGRVDDFAVVENQSNIIYVATASGGVWKTINNGITWEPIFDNESVSTIGDITVAPSDPNIVWVGTGEANNRQSSSWGNGVYKSMDGGKTWINMGLKDSHHVGRIVIDPKNPDVVYVAAAGRLWGPNKERGLFKTSDGGKTWKNVLFINEDTGVIDVAMDYESPNIIYAAAYQRRRTAYGFNGGGPHSALYKSIDGGETWKKLTEGLPSGDTGRIGVDVYRKNPNIVYTIIENKEGGVFRSEDKGETWKKISSTNPRPMYYSQIRIDPNNDQRIWVLGAQMYFSEDGGKTFRTDWIRMIHGDHHALWINPADSNHMVLGSDGGIHISYDTGRSWDFINTIPLGQFYEIGFDMRKPYYVYGGLQDNGSWAGPSATRYRVGITNEDWYNVGGGDGFYAQVDPTDHTIVYVESQDGNLMRFNLKTDERRSIRPVPKDEKEEYRFNWNSPILISPHNPKTIYYGGNKLFKSTDRGETWAESPDLTTNQDRDKLPIMGVILNENTLSRNDGVLHYGTIITISESPLKEGLLYVGTDDGYVQVSKDGGKTWENLTGRIKGVPPNTYVSRVVASRFKEGTVYVTFDGHRSNDFTPYVFVSSDYGENWKSIVGNLPHGHTVNVIRESLKNSNLLFVGTEFGANFSLNRGEKWIRFKGNLPTVPVDDIAIHPRENDLIFGTHGRSVWILDDITPLESLTEKVLSSDCFLFDIKPATIFNPYSHKGSTGHKFFTAPNPPFGALLSYYLRERIKDKDKEKAEVKITIFDKDGKKIRQLKGTNEQGINRINWDLRYEPPVVPEQEQRGFFRGPLSPFVLPGEYTVKLEAAGKEMTKTVRVELNPVYEILEENYKFYHDTLMKLFQLNTSIREADNSIKNLEDQLKNLQKTLKNFKDAPETLNSEIEKVLKKLDEIKGKLIGKPDDFMMRSRAIRGRASMLYFAINSYIDIPTPPQLEQVEKVSQQTKQVITELNETIEKSIPDLNKLIRESNIPYLIPGKKIEVM